MLVCKEKDFSTQRKVQNVMQEKMPMHRGKKETKCLGGTVKCDINKKNSH